MMEAAKLSCLKMWRIVMSCCLIAKREPRSLSSPGYGIGTRSHLCVCILCPQGLGESVPSCPPYEASHGIKQFCSVARPKLDFILCDIHRDFLAYEKESCGSCCCTFMLPDLETTSTSGTSREALSMATCCQRLTANAFSVGSFCQMRKRKSLL